MSYIKKHIKQQQMKLSEQYVELSKKTTEAYKNLVLGVSYDFTQQALAKIDTEYQKDVKSLLESENYRDLSDYDFYDLLPSVYYDTKHGKEKMVYILHIDRETGIHAIQEEDNDHICISYMDISTLLGQILLVEELENI